MTDTTLNIDAINRVADTIETAAKPESETRLGFNMSFFFADGGLNDMTNHGCGTTACIAGWAVATEQSETPDLDKLSVMPSYDIQTRARDMLGLNEIQAHMLFIGGPSNVDFHRVTPEMAVNTLRHLAKTGVVNWNAANA